SLTYFASRYLDNSVTTIMLSFDRSFMINKTIGIKSYIEGGFSEIKHQNFFDSSNKLISNDAKAALIFAGVRFMI
ncbi:MAG: hypothetical protein SFV53_03825, partial [Rickettsiales bacterium]|nr:hypothetical protein [Rickettsiales bacterium]